MKDLRVVIPAYNEELSIAAIIDDVKKSCPDAEIIVVDDGSKDKTAQIGRDKGIKVISNPTNFGYGAALKVGFMYESDTNSTVKYMASLDADGTYPAKRIPDLYKTCKDKGYDLVVGSRFLGKDTGMPIIRRFGNRIFAILLSIYSGKRITDTSTGMRVFNTQILPLFDNLPDSLDFATAMTTYALFNKLSYCEIPIEYYERAGESKLSSLKDGYKFLHIIMSSTRRYRPGLFYVTLGIPFLVLSSVVNLLSNSNLAAAK